MSDEPRELDLANYLSACLAVFWREHRGVDGEAPAVRDDANVRDAIKHVERRALQFVTTGQIPPEFADALGSYMSGKPLPERIRALLEYDVVQDGIAFDTADLVVSRLAGLPYRVQVALLAFTLLLSARPSATATGYLERTLDLYLAGYDLEVFVLCGAVLECAFADRIPDAVLAAKGIKPEFKHSNEYSLKQRRELEARIPFLLTGSGRNSSRSSIGAMMPFTAGHLQRHHHKRPSYSRRGSSA